MALLAASMSLGCPSGEPLSGEESSKYGDCVTPYLRTCAGSSCHSPDGDGFIDLVSEGLDQRIVGVMSQYTGPRTRPCTGGPWPLVVPSAPEESFLIQKLRGTQPCGSEMPPSPDPPPTEAQLDCVLRWIAQLPGGEGGASGAGTAETSPSSSSSGGSAPEPAEEGSP